MRAGAESGGWEGDGSSDLMGLRQVRNLFTSSVEGFRVEGRWVSCSAEKSLLCNENKQWRLFRDGTQQPQGTRHRRRLCHSVSASELKTQRNLSDSRERLSVPL